MVHYCYQEEGNWCTTVLGEEYRCSTVFRRRDLVLKCSQEKETGALLLSRRTKLVLYCSCFQKKGDGAVLYSGERKWCCTKFTG